MSIRLRRQSNGAARLEESPPCVIVLHAKDAKGGAGIVLGRSCSYSDFVISANRRISRRHARATVDENGNWFIEECQNTNGVYVGTQRIRGRTHFRVGQVLAFGSHCNIACSFLVESTSTSKIRSSAAVSAANKHAERPKKKRRVERARSSIRPIKESVVASASSAAAAAPSSKVQPGSQISKLMQELSCSICLDLFIDPVTLECSHSFCRHCISVSLRKRSLCPCCRFQVLQEPVPSHSLRCATQTVVSGEAEVEYEHRIQADIERKLHQAAMLDRLKRTIERAERRGHEFLDVFSHWTTLDRTAFHQMAERHTGTCLRLFCGTVGLTEENIRNRSLPDLLQAANNIVGDPTSVHANNMVDAIRESLQRFVRFGTGLPYH